PMHLRVNSRRGTRDQYMKELATADNAASAPPGFADAVMLTQPIATTALPGFAAGWVSVQDVSAQRAADLLDLAAGQRVLDACAAPGNKTAHVLERAEVDMLALDVDATRLQALQSNLARLQLTATTRVADAGQPADWWDGQPFDRILLDAPCSGT